MSTAASAGGAAYTTAHSAVEPVSGNLIGGALTSAGQLVADAAGRYHNSFTNSPARPDVPRHDYRTQRKLARSVLKGTSEPPTIPASGSSSRASAANATTSTAAPYKFSLEGNRYEVTPMPKSELERLRQEFKRAKTLPAPMQDDLNDEISNALHKKMYDADPLWTTPQYEAKRKLDLEIMNRYMRKD